MSFGLVGAGLGLVSSVIGGFAKRSAAKYNAKVANNNAKAIEQQGAYEQGLQRERNARMLGAQEVAIAKSGASLSGSLLDSLINSAGDGEMDVQAIGYDTKLRSNAERQAAQQFKSQARSSLFTSVVDGTTNLLSNIKSPWASSAPNSAGLKNPWAVSKSQAPWLATSWPSSKIKYKG